MPQTRQDSNLSTWDPHELESLRAQSTQWYLCYRTSSCRNDPVEARQQRPCSSTFTTAVSLCRRAAITKRQRQDNVIGIICGTIDTTLESSRGISSPYIKDLPVCFDPFSPRALIRLEALVLSSLSAGLPQTRLSFPWRSFSYSASHSSGLKRMRRISRSPVLGELSQAKQLSAPILIVHQKPVATYPRNDMEGMAQSVVDTLSPMFNASGVIPTLTADQPAYLMAAISRTDYLSGNTTYKELVLNNMNTFVSLNPAISTTIIPIWGLAAASAFRAYNDSTSLALAVQTWNQVSPYQIQPQDADSGLATAIHDPIPASCNGSSVVGGVFAYPSGSTAQDAQLRPTAVDGETLGAFVALSAHLYELTGDSKYLNAAESGAEFLQNHMQAPQGVSLDTFTVAGCQAVDIQPLTYITGFSIWGLSVLATHNTSWTSFLNTLVSTSVPYTGWTNSSSGIVTEGSSDETDNFAQPSDVLTDGTTSCLKAVWIRGLHEAWTRMDPTSAPAKYIEAYLYVQLTCSY
ncbi:hypothetical protein NM688_g8360 [Phlebia brevispora]|uniref:Uncharacterized protein n=1 Tax=Phlebia brevispora TaxID=194682 RepID=A0ACC1RTZ8_9APHY|nr:hypothetical protein NM688_g8360 [Phlebia brevispora]